jgi:hypothetical protein
MAKRRFSTRLASDEITTHGYRVVTFCKEYNYHDSRAHSHERSGILSRLAGFGCGMVWTWFWFRLSGVV